jgi:hypothetical protein
MYTLFIWTLVVYGGNYDWRPLAQFENQTLCEAGARQLGIKDTRFRCVRTK